MARTKKDATVNLDAAQELTAGLIERLTCPSGKTQAFLRDVKAPGLRVRVTATGAKSYVFEAKLNRQTIRRTIGDVRAWTIEAARTEANRLRVVLDGGGDPREIERATQAAAADRRASESRHAVTVGEAWAVYVVERSPMWGELHRIDHDRKASAGGVASTRGTRGTGKTQPGPLYPLMALPLRSLDAAIIESWAAKEGKTRPSSARLAWRLLKVFLGWCAEQPAYASIMAPKNPAKTTKTRESLGKPATKSDVLQRGQLATWFTHVLLIPNINIAAALQTMLLTGARPGEVIALRWKDVDTQWHGLTIRDKVEGERTIPLTPYVANLLATLPRRNQWVFSSATSKIGHITEPNAVHSTACTVAGLEGLTLHGLRRSFKSLTEWLDMPAGVVAQLMGHKPSATAEKHYTVRPLDLLRVHHERIEAWILEQASVDFSQASMLNGHRTDSQL